MGFFGEAAINTNSKVLTQYNKTVIKPYQEKMALFDKLSEHAKKKTDPYLNSLQFKFKAADINSVLACKGEKTIQANAYEHLAKADAFDPEQQADFEKTAC